MTASGSIDESATVAVTGSTAADDTSSIPFRPARSLARYLVIEKIGQGGMGVVLRAYDPKLQREVALKVVRTRSLDESAQARLVREARAMARLSHPNVVGVYDVELDANVNVDGVVLVMEYVRGSTLRQWLTETSRSATQILDVFVAAGQGLAAAHATGLLHRDFKLDNVLLGSDGRVRVTDFGLARATGPHDESDERSSMDDPAIDHGVDDELTTVGTVLGTPRYMAPEQAVSSPLDPRVDQYAFCVALWRALAGSWPFEGKGDALLQAKRKGPPPWPNDPSVPPVPRHVVRAIRRGLACEPDERWPHMPALLDELRRDPSRRRHRALGVGALVLAGLGTWGWGQWQRARASSACEAEAARIDAVWHADRAKTLATAFEATSASHGAEAWKRVRERIDIHAAEWSAARRDNCEAANVTAVREPEIAQASRDCLDEQLDHLDALLDLLAEPDETLIFRAAVIATSLPPVQPCVDEARVRYRADPPDPAIRDDVRALRSRLSRALAASAAGHYDLALERCDAILDEATALGWPPLVAEAKFARGDVVMELGRHEEARADLEEAFFIAGATGHEHRALRAAASLIFLVGVDLAQHDVGLQWGRMAEMVAGRLDLSDGHEMSNVLNNIGNVYEAKGKHGRALESHIQALELRERLLGPDHPLVARSLSNLGDVRMALGENSEARQLQERSLAINKKVLGEEHPAVAQSYNNLAAAYAMARDFDRALEAFEAARVIMEKAYGPRHHKLAMTLANIGALQIMMDSHESALPLLEQAWTIFEETLGPDHPHTASAVDSLGFVHDLRGDHERAMEHYERAYATRTKMLEPGHPQLADSLERIAGVLEKTGSHDAARRRYEEVLAIRESADVTPVKLALARFGLARTLVERDHDRAIGLAADARETFRRLSEEMAEDHTETVASIDAWLESHTAG